MVNPRSRPGNAVFNLENTNSLHQRRSLTQLLILHYKRGTTWKQRFQWNIRNQTEKKKEPWNNFISFSPQALWVIKSKKVNERCSREMADHHEDTRSDASYSFHEGSMTNSDPQWLRKFNFYRDKRGCTSGKIINQVVGSFLHHRKGSSLDSG